LPDRILPCTPAGVRVTFHWMEGCPPSLTLHVPGRGRKGIRMNAKRLLQYALAFLMPLGLLSTCALAGDNAAAVKEFGIAKGEPIDKGFFFWNYEYVEAPYVVERRGLDVLINNRLLRPGPEWPQYDYEVKEDPGDPPDDSLPWDPVPAGVDRRDTYWAKKSGYLHAHHDSKTAQKKLLETYRRSPAVREVHKHEVVPDTWVIVTKPGREVAVYLGDTTRPTPNTGDLLGARDAKCSFYKGMLKRGDLLFVSRGFELSVPSERARRALDVLMSQAADDEKLRLLEENRIIRRWAACMRRIVTDFKASPQLLERLGGTRLTAEEVARKYARPDRSGSRKRKLTPDEERARAEQAERGERWVQKVRERRRWKALDAERDQEQAVPEAAPARPRRSGALEAGRDDREVMPSTPVHEKSKVVWLVVGLWSLVAVTALALAMSRSRRMSRARD